MGFSSSTRSLPVNLWNHLFVTNPRECYSIERKLSWPLYILCVRQSLPLSLHVATAVSVVDCDAVLEWKKIVELAKKSTVCFQMRLYHACTMLLLVYANTYTGFCPGWSEWWLYLAKWQSNFVKSSNIVLQFTMRVVVKVAWVVAKMAEWVEPCV